VRKEGQEKNRSSTCPGRRAQRGGKAHARINEIREKKMISLVLGPWGGGKAKIRDQKSKNSVSRDFGCDEVNSETLAEREAKNT